MRVLVTGGAGLIGMALRRVLPSFGHEVTAVDVTDFGRRDGDLLLVPLADVAGLEAIILERRIEAIVHGGGISGPVMERSRPVHVAEVNVMSTAALLDVCRRYDLKRFLLLSSHVVYGDTGGDLIIEERPLHPGTTYAATKVAGEALVESFARQFGLSGASLRLTRVYGPHRRANCFLREIIINAAAGRTTRIPCDPAYLYHFVHVDDVAEAVAAGLAATRLGHYTYNVTSGEVLTMPQIVAIAGQALPGASVELIPGVDDAPEVQTDFSLARIGADTGWRPRLPLATGFAAYVRALNTEPSLAN